MLTLMLLVEWRVGRGSASQGLDYDWLTRLIPVQTYIEVLGVNFTVRVLHQQQWSVGVRLLGLELLATDGQRSQCFLQEMQQNRTGILSTITICDARNKRMKSRRNKEGRHSSKRVRAAGDLFTWASGNINYLTINSIILSSHPQPHHISEPSRITKMPALASEDDTENVSLLVLMPTPAMWSSSMSIGLLWWIVLFCIFSFKFHSRLVLLADWPE